MGMIQGKTTFTSEVTRKKLIDAGLTLFAKYGVDGVRTRQLAEAAEVNQSAIPYHFGGKAAVYAAVIEHIALELSEKVAQPISEMHARLNSKNNSQQKTKELAMHYLPELMHVFTLALLSPAQSDDRTLLIIREQLQPTESYAYLYEKFITPVHTTLSQLVALIKNKTGEDLETITCAHALIGQCLAFIVAKQAYLKRIKHKSLDESTIHHIVQTITRMSLAAVI